MSTSKISELGTSMVATVQGSGRFKSFYRMTVKYGITSTSCGIRNKGI